MTELITPIPRNLGVGKTENETALPDRGVTDGFTEYKRRSAEGPLWYTVRNDVISTSRYPLSRRQTGSRSCETVRSRPGGTKTSLVGNYHQRESADGLDLISDIIRFGLESALSMSHGQDQRSRTRLSARCTSELVRRGQPQQWGAA